MSYLSFVIVYCLKQLNGERSIYSVYHILKGKKSSQSIQDAHLYRLQPFFLSLPKLSRNYFDEKIQSLSDSQMIMLNEDSRAQLTPEGEKALEGMHSTFFFPEHMNGLLYGDRGFVFWRRLNLLTQVLSNHRHEETSYYPVQRNRSIQGWIKDFLHKNDDWDRMASSLFQELHESLTRENDPYIIVSRLTGYKDYGLTEMQAAEELKLHAEEYRYRFLDLIHSLIQWIDGNEGKYPILSSLSSLNQTRKNITLSTAKTYELFLSGHSIEEIAQLRKLKVNTIEDHFIEIILSQDQVDVDAFITPSELVHAISVIEELGTRRLKPIKDRLPHLSYFQIRIAIAKRGDRNDT
ncbi:helix-turn-helix domain-containing protein [Rossellomorea aquimaris]|uniref:helix-turn-helix domain-containing protein n=1 Tax=Rossellomorea aquimaris TaxID=189382 RepID=UPI001CD3AB9B|nr:helix-turn-helix domain-containing protein [Rossellomorea aquimaris]MCA1054681.1 helix-turn-helix domain-containing protein [Rossellomorea aquimaris]